MDTHSFFNKKIFISTLEINNDLKIVIMVLFEENVKKYILKNYNIFFLYFFLSHFHLIHQDENSTCVYHHPRRIIWGDIWAKAFKYRAIAWPTLLDNGVWWTNHWERRHPTKGHPIPQWPNSLRKPRRKSSTSKLIMGTNPEDYWEWLVQVTKYEIQFSSWKDITNGMLPKITTCVAWHVSPWPIASLVKFPKFDLTLVSV